MWRQSEEVATYTSLREFLISAIKAYPADQVLLSLVGHGGGWSPDLYPGQPSFHEGKPSADPLGGMLWDESSGSSLSTKELGDALRESKAATGKKIDLLYLDACLMAMSEVAYEVYDNANFLLAAESWSWTSFRYDQHLAILDGSLSAEEIGKRWIAHEAEELTGNEATHHVNYPFTYSLLDLTLLPQLLEMEDGLADALIESINSQQDGKEKIQAAFEASACFDGDQNYIIDNNDYYCDLHSFAVQLASQFGAGTLVAQQAVGLKEFIQNSIRKDEKNNPGRPWGNREQEWNWGELGGVSIYLPLGADDWKRAFYNGAFVKSAADGRWDEFLNAYWNAVAPVPDNVCGATCEPVTQAPDPEYVATSILHLPMIMND